MEMELKKKIEGGEWRGVENIHDYLKIVVKSLDAIDYLITT